MTGWGLLRPVRAQLLVLRRPTVLGSLLGLLPALAVIATTIAFLTADRGRNRPRGASARPCCCRRWRCRTA